MDDPRDPQPPSADRPRPAGSQNPESQYPESQYPESQYPESQYPESQYPESQRPESQGPDDGPPGGDVTHLLVRAREGGDDALEALLPAVYGELRRLAAGALRRERRDHTLEPTALVHEAWMKLVDQRSRDWQNRAHFMAIAATAMRRVLVHHAEKVRAAKRGGDRRRVTLLDQPGEAPADGLEVLALDEALTRLERHDPRKARVVELRFFSGLEHTEIAEALGVTTRTVERDWRMARAWLRNELEREPADD